MGLVPMSPKTTPSAATTSAGRTDRTGPARRGLNGRRGDPPGAPGAGGAGGSAGADVTGGAASTEAAPGSPESGTRPAPASGVPPVVVSGMHRASHAWWPLPPGSARTLLDDSPMTAQTTLPSGRRGMTPH